MNNRELIFRAWHREREEMYWFDLMWGQTSRSGSGWIGMLPIGEEIKYDVFCPDNRILINPDECDIMQFTGLLDKEGNRIFEGDIMEIPDYSKGIFIIGRQPKKLKVCEWSDGFHGASFKDVQVLGNIHENKNLLDQSSPTY